MSVDLSPSGVFGWASGLALLGLAALVLRIRPFKPLAVGFALFCAGIGFASFMANFLRVDDSLFASFILVSTLSLIPSLVGAGMLAACFPITLERGRRWPLVVAAAAALCVSFAVVIVIRSAPPTSIEGLPADAERALRFIVTTSWAFRGVDVGLLLAFALRYPALEPAAQRAVAVVSAGLVLFPAFFVGRVLVGAAYVPAEGTGPLLASIVILALIAWAIVWLVHGVRTPANARTARTVAWIGLGSVVAGTAMPFLARHGAADFVDAASGLARLGAVAVWAIAIFRHQALGVDAKVRFAISKSTIAAVFIAVFFIASEAAQQFFGEQFESGYLGILAAGVLVFAIAPLSRLADRIAEKAVPVAAPRGPMPRPADDEHAIVAYRAALAASWRDGMITPDEELALARLADRLGLPASVVVEVRHEAERAGGRRHP